MIQLLPQVPTSPAWPAADGTRPEDLTPGASLKQQTHRGTLSRCGGMGSLGERLAASCAHSPRGRARLCCPGSALHGGGWQCCRLGSQAWVGGDHPQGSSVALERQAAAARSRVGWSWPGLGSHPQPQGCPLITLHVDKTSETVRHLRKAAR